MASLPLSPRPQNRLGFCHNDTEQAGNEPQIDASLDPIADYETSLSQLLDEVDWLHDADMPGWGMLPDAAAIGSFLDEPLVEHRDGSLSPNCTSPVDDMESLGLFDTESKLKIEDDRIRSEAEMALPSYWSRIPQIASETRKKRSISAVSECSGAGSDPDGPKRKSAKTKNNQHGLLACPFQKHDPIRYRDCLKLKLARIKDVKQHLRRRHKQPYYYCSRCWTVFDQSHQRDEHTRLADCAVKEMPNFEGITDQQDKELIKSSDRKLDVEEQWFQLWQTLFPDQQKPQTAFLNGYADEIVSLLRSIWSDQRCDILRNALDGNIMEASLGPLVDGIMENVFDAFRNETAWTPSAGSAWSALSGFKKTSA